MNRIIKVVNIRRISTKIKDGSNLNINYSEEVNRNLREINSSLTFISFCAGTSTIYYLGSNYLGLDYIRQKKMYADLITHYYRK